MGGKNKNACVRAFIDKETVKQASTALAAMGLSISDAIHLLMIRIANGERLPFEIKSPNVTTRNAIMELETGRGRKFYTIESLMDSLHESD